MVRGSTNGLIFTILICLKGCSSQFGTNFCPGLNCGSELSVCETLNTFDYNIELVAGTIDTSGSTNSTLTGSTFDRPSAMIFPSSTQFIVRDENNFRLRLVNIGSNTVSNFAGNGVDGVSGDGGPLLSAQFNTDDLPGLMASRSNGDLFVPSPAHYICRISGSSVFSFAGLINVSGTADGNTTTARFNAPSSVVVDSSDNIFVADSGNHCVRKIDPSGNVTTFVGLCGTLGETEGNGTAARLTNPFSLAIDSSDSLYITFAGRNRLYKATSSGDFTFFVGDGSPGDTDGTGLSAQIRPVTVSTDGCDSIFITDSVGKVKKISQDGVVTTIAGTGATAHTGDGGPALSADINGVGAVVVNPHTNEIFFTELLGHTIRKLVPQ